MIKIFYVKNQKGFSLIEMMVVVVILGLIVLGLVTFFTGGAKSWVAGQSQLEAQRNARQAIDRMVREIRHGNLMTSKLEYSISVSIPELNGSAYNVKYSWSGTPGGSINREVSGASNIVIDSVKTLKFTYPDESKVRILLEVDVDDDGNADITLNTDVNLRNFGL